VRAARRVRAGGPGKRAGGDTGTAPWADLTIHLAPELADFAAENKEWLRIYRLPAYAPDINPAEGIWSLLKRSIANFAAADLDGLVRIIKRKLKKIQYRPHLIEGCLAGTGLKLEPW
jgi:transposase